MDSGEPEAFPFIETTIARRMMLRMRQTHEERGITVISGPWGIGKTSAIDAFEREFDGQCAIVKVEPAPTSRGLKTLRMLQLVIEALKELNHRQAGGYLGNSPWMLKQNVAALLKEWWIDQGPDAAWPPTFTLIFDEAQYLSREAIELLRYWNDADRCSMPFPVGLVFVGNNEFAMQETAAGESVLSGAVRSRLTWEVPLSYEDLSDMDMTLFLQSRGVTNEGALSEFVGYFSHYRIKRDLRQVNRVIERCKRMADGGAITGQIVRDILHPA